MRKILTVICIVMLGILCLINYAMPADAAKKTAKKPKIDEAQLEQMTQKVDTLTKKYYTRELFSPEDCENLIGIKLELDTIMNTMQEPVYAPVYFKLGTLFKLRNMNPEAIDCFKTVLENFQDTAYGPKSREILAEMGVEIKESEPVLDEEEEEEEYY